MAADELEFVEWLREQQRAHAAVGLGIGDDMAVVQPSIDPARPAVINDRTDRLLLLSCDMLLDGVHFDTAKHGFEQIGRKAIACNLSDCAAMAVRPVAATVSVALPAERPLSDAQDLFRGIFAMAADFDLAIVGGDTTRWNNPLAIDVAITATPFDGIDPVTRAGAKAGDMLYVTGPLGGSLLGRHMDFTPRVIEAKAIAEAFGDRLHAMMDISDGLSLDLWRMCQASHVGAMLDEHDLQQVISDDARRLAQSDGLPAFEHALTDGEDFELLIAAAGTVSVAGVLLHQGGIITEAAFAIKRIDGRIDPLEPKGFLH